MLCIVDSHFLVRCQRQTYNHIPRQESYHHNVPAALNLLCAQLERDDKTDDFFFANRNFRLAATWIAGPSFGKPFVYWRYSENCFSAFQDQDGRGKSRQQHEFHAETKSQDKLFRIEARF